MGHRWTLEAKAKQSQLIRSWRPWEQSTGPQSAEGKARSGQNAEKRESVNRRMQLIKEEKKRLIRQSKEFQEMVKR